jgi:hypothetical protein
VHLRWHNTRLEVHATLHTQQYYTLPILYKQKNFRWRHAISTVEIFIKSHPDIGNYSSRKPTIPDFLSRTLSANPPHHLNINLCA